MGDLRLAPQTKVYLGVIHSSDGVEGAERRIAAAETVLSDFGVASFCGLGNPIAAQGDAPVSVGNALHRDIRDSRARLDEIMTLHRDVALLG